MAAIIAAAPAEQASFSQAAPGSEEAAIKGDALCQLGVCHQTGAGMPKDAAKAVECYEAAAKLGHVVGMYNLAVCYANGEGAVARNDSIAARWFQRASDAGHAEATACLAHAYELAAGVSKNKAKSVDLYRKAAVLGSPKAKDSLKRLHVHD